MNRAHVNQSINKNFFAKFNTKSNTISVVLQKLFKKFLNINIIYEIIKYLCKTCKKPAF
jgi:hypothetical protein